MAVYFVGSAALKAEINAVKTNNEFLNHEIEVLRSMEFGGVGRIEKYAASTPPQNTIKANGAELSRETFWRLWEYAQASGNLVDQASKQRGQFGTGDGSTTFTIPDHRGVASRGFDDGAGLDSAPTLGRYQSDNNKSHTHSMNAAGNHAHSGRTAAAGNHSHSETVTRDKNGRHQLGSYSNTSGKARLAYKISVAGNHTHGFTTNGAGNHTHSINSSGATEATMKNVSFLYCIRYQ